MKPRLWAFLVALLTSQAAAPAATEPSPVLRKVLSELFPGHSPPSPGGILAPSRPGLPQVGIVATLEKPWARLPGQVIVALQIVRFVNGYHEVKGCPDTVLAVVRTGGKQPELVARSGFLAGVPREPGGHVEGFQDCRKLTEIDTAEFRIADGEAAFGLRLRHDHLTRTDVSYRESLSLFRVTGGSVQSILTTESERCDCAIVGGRGCGRMLGPRGRCEPADGSAYRKTYLKMLPGQTRGMHDIARLEEQVPGAKPAEAGIYRWDGERYRLAP
jgi:hypothetical protein